MSDDFSPIRPKQVPLSHTEPAGKTTAGRGASLITWALGLLLALGLLAGVFFLLPAWLESTAAPIAGAGPSGGAPEGGAAGVPAAAGEAQRQPAEQPGLPPYQQLQRQQAREQAQKELARFVELQIELEENMQVGAWGRDDFDRAKGLAAAGDEAFLREQFQASIASYRAATDELAALIERGKKLLEQALEEGATALAARDQARAEQAFELAGTIAPEDPRVAAGQARAAKLPQTSELMRQGRNQELAEDWTGAGSTYAQVRDLDPETRGLEEALARVAEGQRQQRLQALLSEGFTRLDDGRFEAARKAFRDALALDPGNAVAEGGLEQVAKRAVVARVTALEHQAAQAAAEERWQDAAALYAEVLEVDGTIQFARAGRANALAQQRTAAALAKIIQSPERLSSDRLYQEAREILARSEALDPRGRKLASQIEDVRAILQTYAEPVPVVLRSDNQTEITVSTVGTLGSFTEKRLELRPGAYTVIGSRDGCRDVREQIVVRPNMNPVDIRCVETL